MSTGNKKNIGEPLEWHTEVRKVKDIHIWDQNPRQITERGLEMLKKRIERRGFHDVVKVDLDGTILSGNQRKLVLDDLGIEEIECKMPNRHLTAEERIQVALESNLNDGFWLDEKLAEFSSDVLADLGFTDEQMDAIFGDVEEDDFVAEEEKPVKPESKRGDVYRLGNHRLMCGDATSREDMKRLMNDKRARLVFTDPPYNVDYKSPAGHSYDSDHYGGGKVFSDDKSDNEALLFYTLAAKRLHESTTDDANIYWWFAMSNVEINRYALLEAGWHISQTIFWLKNMVIVARGMDFHRTMESCLHGWKKGKKHFYNKIGDYKDVMNIEEFELLLDAWYEARDVATQDYIHPTQKPVGLAERAIKKSSQRGDIVLDVFGGSGSTLMACEQLGRKCYMMELDPKYVDVIIKRWEGYTGDNVELL